MKLSKLGDGMWDLESLLGKGISICAVSCLILFVLFCLFMGGVEWREGQEVYL